MNFTVELDDFQEAVNKTLPAIPPKSTLPVLEHLKFVLEDNTLQIISTDQEITIKTVLETESGDNGSILIPGRKLNDILRALGKQGKITLKIDDENFKIDIVTDNGTYEMKGLSIEEYLELPELFESDINAERGETEESVVINKNEVIRIADKTAFAVSSDDFRPAMTGVLFQFRGNKLLAVSTDSYRLVKAVYTSEENLLEDELDIIIPSRTMDILKKADDDVTFSFIKNNEKITHIRFKIGNTIYISRIIDEKFPPYESVIPEGNNIKAVFNKSKMLSGIKRVAIFSNDITKQIRLDLKSENLTLTGKDEDSGTKADESMECQLEGDNIEIGFNYKYLDDAISHIDPKNDGNVFMTFSDPNKPALIMPSEDDDELLMLIMPVRIN